MAASASISVSRLISTTAATPSPISSSRSAPSLLPYHKPLSSKPSSSFKPLPHPKPIKFSTKTTSTISIDEKLPDATLSYFDSAGELQTTTISSLTQGKKAILFAVPGAFTPTCVQKHLPRFVEKSAELKSKGVDTIACISVNDAFVMKAWKENLGIINDEVLLLSDGNEDFTKAIGFER
ncbi:peroxiredoxin-2E chloroplastic [Tripterygium wilfordii]|uniref:Glutaredoxin-dependent peroxiredoxin n=1 Tax=Tripterygium wilfordii TaxID=458696 RepID=A0A7J7DW03_TRIWF|nr:peroxiredoxin-2E chloroplastic [Tripterygium wilfordii]